LPSFEGAIKEHIRVARKKVICILWYSFGRSPEHVIKNITNDGKEYREYLNTYSIYRVYYHLIDIYPDWGFNIYCRIGRKDRRADTIIYLYNYENCDL
jgi:hypothetical protein